ncbi:MAG: hypothetical protein QG635_778 [Bacteroidota bacterium]|nr:hypothetical protein [Bacteroidota bacterium]
MDSSDIIMKSVRSAKLTISITNIIAGIFFLTAYFYFPNVWLLIGAITLFLLGVFAPIIINIFVLSAIKKFENKKIKDNDGQ